MVREVTRCREKRVNMHVFDALKIDRVLSDQWTGGIAWTYPSDLAAILAPMANADLSIMQVTVRGTKGRR